MVEPDTIIDGRYKVISRVGSGGMADVYLAEDQLLGRQVAVKLLHHHFAEDQEFVERFRREASSAAGLSHQNIVGIFDRGEWEGTYYIAMEYVAGRSLKTIVREEGPLDPARAIDLVVQILRGARFAHRRGVVHRDLKPHNVILDEEGRARVTDFGIARAGASDMTLTGSIMGTAQYLSPEQAQGYVVSGASDLYSIGVILYELLTGVVPFDGETAVAIAFKQVSAQARPPSEVNPSVPPALDAVVLRALAKDPAQRYADADEFIAALVREREALPASARAVATTGTPGGHGYGGAVSVAPVGQAHDGAPPATGAMLLADDGYDEDPGAGDGPGIRRVLLWGLLAALVVGAIVAAVLLLSSPARQVSVPNVTGETEQAASAKLRSAGLSAAPSLASSASVASGRVISQSPTGGSRVDSGASVSIVVSSGPGSAALPSVEGLTSAQALSRLAQGGLQADEQGTAQREGRAGARDRHRTAGGHGAAGGQPGVGAGLQRAGAGARAGRLGRLAERRGSGADGCRPGRGDGHAAGLRGAGGGERAVAVAVGGLVGAHGHEGEPDGGEGVGRSGRAESGRPVRDAGRGGARRRGLRAERGHGGDERRKQGGGRAQTEPNGRPHGAQGLDGHLDGGREGNGNDAHDADHAHDDHDDDHDDAAAGHAAGGRGGMTKRR